MTMGAIFDDEGRFLHYCHCGAWGSLGVGVRLLRGRLGTWYCAALIADAKPEEIDMSETPQTTMTMTIPTRFRAMCEFCGHELNTQTPGVHQFTSGWVMNRTGGGGHGISLAERSNRWAHRHCIEAATRGTAQQQRMF